MLIFTAIDVKISELDRRKRNLNRCYWERLRLLLRASLRRGDDSTFEYLQQLASGGCPPGLLDLGPSRCLTTAAGVEALISQVFPFAGDWANTKRMETNVCEQVHQQHVENDRVHDDDWTGGAWKDGNFQNLLPSEAGWCVSRRACVLIGRPACATRVTTPSHARRQRLGAPRLPHQSAARARAAGFNTGSVSTQRLQNTSEPPPRTDLYCWAQQSHISILLLSVRHHKVKYQK